MLVRIQWRRDTADNWSQANTVLSEGEAGIVIGDANPITFKIGDGVTPWNSLPFAGGGSGGGTVTSVAMTVPAIMSVTGSPVTTSGTLALSLADQDPNLILAGPTTGPAATPTFRAIVAADLPLSSTSTTGALSSTDWNIFNAKQPAGAYMTALTGDIVAAGPGSSVSTYNGVLPLLKGGTGTAAASANAAFAALSPLTTKGDILGFSTANGRFPVGSNTQVLTADSTQTFGFKWATPTVGTVTTVSVVTANGVSGSVANPTTTPAITLTLGAITPSSVAASGSMSGSNLSGTNTGDQTITLTGDVTGSGTGSFATTIAANAVTNAKLAQMATHTIKGNATGGTANAADLTGTQVTALLDAFTNSLQGVVPGSGGGTANFLRADGSWAAPAYPVTSVANTDGTLTISPTTGAVVASLALGHANHWTAAQTFDIITLPITTSSVGQITQNSLPLLHTFGGTFFGTNAGNFTSTGTTNVGVGAYTLLSNTSGDTNVAVGFAALELNTTGSNNVALGSLALNANTIGHDNFGLGASALAGNTTGSSNVAIGTSALATNVSTSDNVAIGTAAMSTSTCNSGVGIGSHALAASTGVSNTAIGNVAGRAITSGALNTAVGAGAMNSSTTGSNNVAIGYFALGQAIAADQNVALGFEALTISTGADNVGVGFEALLNATTGAGNTAIGSLSALSLTTGSNNTSIGKSSNIAAAISNATAIGANASVTASNTMVFGASVTDYNFRALNYNFPAAQAAGVLTNNGSGALTWTAIVSGVSSVSNSDGTLTISPTTGAVVASLNLAHANTWTATQIINLNASAAPSPATGTGLQVVGADSGVARVEVDSFGQIAAMTVRRANGTGASPIAIISGDQIGAFNAHGYYVTGGPAYSSVQASIAPFATQNWTSTTLGTKWVIRTTPNGSTTLTDAATFGQDQSLAVVGAITGSNLSGTNTGDQVLPTGANPTGTIGLATVNGSATTFLRSDSSQPLSQAIVPTWTGKHIFAITARTSGSASYFAIQAPADTTLAASTEAIGMQFGGDASLATVTRQFATGALAMQRSSVFVAPTYAFVGASTLSVASTVAITGTPIAGTNATITFPYSLLVTGAVGATPVTGTNTVGNALTLITGLGTGTGASGAFNVQVSPSAATGVSGSAYLAPITMINILGTTGKITIGDSANTWANGTVEIYHGSGFSGQGLNLRNSGTATAGSAAINIISSGTGVANIINSGAYVFLRSSTQPAFVLNGVGGANVMTISQLTTSPSTAVLGYAAGVNTTTPSIVATWRELSTSTATTPIFQVRTLADTTLTASTEAVGNAFGGDGSYATVTRQWATGALTTQRENVFVAPTYGFVGATTVTTAATVAITGAPTAGTNATITNNYALWIQAGNANFAGKIGVACNPTQLLDVQGAFNSVGQIRAKGISDAGYFAADSDGATQETGYRFYKVGAFKGAIYVASNASAVTLTNSGGVDVASWSSAGFNVIAAGLNMTDAINIAVGTSTGTKIGTATSQKIGLWNAAPIIQPINTVAIDTLLTNTGLRASGGVANFDTDIKAAVVGKGIYIKEGSNATMGTGTLSSGTATISTTKVTASSRIFLTDAGGGIFANIGSLSVGTVTAGTSFVVNSSNAIDSSNFNWIIIEPA